MDINGMACSIELYLGRDILCEEDGSLIPIQWIGYFENAGKYQGRILDKANCLKKFFDKMSDKDIAEMFGVCRQSINGIRRGITWKHI